MPTNEINDEKKVKIFKKTYIRFALGLLFALLAISMCLNVGPIATYSNYGMVFLFGVFFFVPWALLFVLGFYLMFFKKTKKKHHKFSYIMGGIILFLGLLILLSLIARNDINMNFYDEFMAALNPDGVMSLPVKVFDLALGGGIIGYSFAGLLATFLTLAGAYAIAALIILLGGFIIALPFIIKAIKNSKKRKKETSSLEEDNFKNEEEAKPLTYLYETTLNERFKNETILHNTSYDLRRENEEEEKMDNFKMDDRRNNVEENDNSTYIKKEPYREEIPTYIVRDDRGLTKAHLFLPDSHRGFYKNEEVSVTNKVVMETPIATKEEVHISPIVNDSNVRQQQINVPSVEPSFETIKEEIPSSPAEENKPPLVNNPVEHLFTSKVEQAEVKVLTPKGVEMEETIDNNAFGQPKAKPRKPYVFPDASLLNDYEIQDAINKNIEVSEERMQKMNEIIEDLHVGAKIVGYTIGPSITRFDVQTNRDVLVSNVERIVRDLSIRLDGTLLRFEAIVRGKSTSGIEMPNAKTTMVSFKEVFNNLEPVDGYKNRMYIPFGKDITGKVIGANVDEFPHFLVAGTTGSGKSIYMHSVILSLIMRNRPEDLKLMIVDPKRVEMSRYRDLPHLLCPIITEPKPAKVAFDRLVDEMERRYDLFADSGSSNINQYNEYAKEHGLEPLPSILAIVDEYGDLVQTVKEIQGPVLRLGQKSRASGIHMLISTQRPAVNIITGDIKANIPVRVALMTSSATDSVTIIGEGGAELLLGKGDMLVDCSLISRSGVTRLQSAFVDNHEIARVVKFIKDQMEPQYDPNFLDLEEKSQDNSDFSQMPGHSGGEKGQDDLYPEVVDYVKARDYASISGIQRFFSIGFPRAGKLFAQLQRDGIIAPTSDSPSNSKGCKVLIRSSIVIPEGEEVDVNSTYKTIDDQNNQYED